MSSGFNPLRIKWNKIIFNFILNNFCSLRGLQKEFEEIQELLLVLSADWLYLGAASSQASISAPHPSFSLPSFLGAAHDPPGKQHLYKNH